MSRAIIKASQVGRLIWPSNPIRLLSAGVLTAKSLRQPQSILGRFGREKLLPSSAAQFLPGRRLFHSWPRLSARPSKIRPKPRSARGDFSPERIMLLVSDSGPTTTTTTTTVLATCSSVADSAWQRKRQDGVRAGFKVVAERHSSSIADKVNSSRQSASKPATHAGLANPHPTSHERHDPGTLTESVSKYLHLPHLPQRPTKEELLAAATGFWQRLKVRFKWASIRSNRPWNADEWGAFVSAFFFGHLVWVLVGTTTFFSLIILLINTVFAQETQAKWIGDYLTRSAGLTVIFESAIVPKWGNGVITFKNVFVSRRPGLNKSSVKKGSSNAAAEAAAARQVGPETAAVEDEGNYTQFDVTISTVNVSLSFLKWWSGKGLLKDVEVQGVRGVVDRTSVRWLGVGIDPLHCRRAHQPGDFELDSFRMEDLLVTVHQPGGFRPFPVAIYTCELSRLRKRFFFYDFLSASHMSGAFDGSLFAIHPRQIVGSADENSIDRVAEQLSFRKLSRMRIDGLRIDHLNRGIKGPFGWIYEGNVDIVADVIFPADDDAGISKVVAELCDKMEEAVTSNRYLKMLENNSRRMRQHATQVIQNSDLAALSPIQSESLRQQEQPALALPSSTTSDANEEQTEEMETVGDPPVYLIMDLRIHLNDVRAAVPLLPNPEIGYVNQSLVRPIVAYINAKHTYIPISARIIKRASDFDGSWSAWDCRLLDDLAAEVYTAFAKDVQDHQGRVRRLKRVGLWTLSLVVHALLAGVTGDLM